jgi:hypothetical protein
MGLQRIQHNIRKGCVWKYLQQIPGSDWWCVVCLYLTWSMTDPRKRFMVWYVDILHGLWQILGSDWWCVVCLYLTWSMTDPRKWLMVCCVFISYMVYDRS